MTAFLPVVATQAKIDAAPVADGRLMVASDTGEMFLDYGGGRIRIQAPEAVIPWQLKTWLSPGKTVEPEVNAAAMTLPVLADKESLLVSYRIPPGATAPYTLNLALAGLWADRGEEFQSTNTILVQPAETPADEYPGITLNLGDRSYSGEPGYAIALHSRRLTTAELYELDYPTGLIMTRWAMVVMPCLASRGFN